MSTDPQDSYHAHQAVRQVYVVLRVDEGDAPLASRFTVTKILRSYDAAQREVARLNATGKTHVWQVGWLALDDGPAREVPVDKDELERLRAERDSLRAELEAEKRRR